MISPVNVTKFVGNCGLVIFTEEIVNEKFRFLCSVYAPVNSDRQKTFRSVAALSNQIFTLALDYRFAIF